MPVRRVRERNVLIISFDVNHICTAVIMNLFMISQLHSSSIYILKIIDIQVLEADSAEEDSDDDILDEEVEDALEDDEFAGFEVEDAEEVAEEDDEILVQPAAQSQRPVRASFGYVPSVTVQWDRFCNDFIAAHQLTADKTWKRRGLLTTLESALRDDHDLKREQVSDVKKHIDFILSNQPEQ